MIGPLLQGIMLVGVIYWYSKGMLTLINDYYRDEFKTYMEKDLRKELRPKLDQLPADSEGACTAIPIEGLPDILKLTNEFTKADGVITRDTDRNVDKTVLSLMSNRQCKSKSRMASRQTLSVDDKNGAVSRSQLLNSIKLDFVTSSAEDDKARKCESTDNIDKLILNPSVVNKLSYRQMANQQVSDVNDGKLTGTTTTRTMAAKLNRNGNCFEDDGRTNAEKSSVVDGLEAPMMSQMPPKISISGVDVSEQLLKRQITGKNSNICKRKSVNQMVQFWSNYQEGMASDGPSSQEQWTTAAGNLNSDIITPNG